MYTGFDLEPFRSPEYWNGNILGETPVDSGETGRRTAALCAFAAEALTAKLHTMHTYWPEENIRHGQQFDVNEHAPGTVIRFRRERIVRSLFATATGPAQGAEFEIPPNDLGRSGMEWWHMSDRNGFYTSSGFWGVVTPAAGRVAAQNLLAIPDNISAQPQLNFAPAVLFARVMPRQTTVGEVYGLPRYGMGFRRKQAARKNQYIRVTALDVVGEAGRRQPKRLEELAERLTSGLQSPAIEGSA